jgi:transcriptional regulator with XRE-family HTH domain
MARASKIHEADLLAMARRLHALRVVTGFSQAEFAKEYGFSQTQWSNFERAVGRISIDAALVLNERLKVPLDWIYTGEDAWLPAGLRDRIAQVPTEEIKRAGNAAE